MKIKTQCAWCSKVVERYPSQIIGLTFCSKKCIRSQRSREGNPDGYRRAPHLSEVNRRMNPTKMTDAVKDKLRTARLGTGTGKTYTKRYGRHEHRIVAEQMLGRPLEKGEVVHHIDGDRRNNLPENLKILASQADHARLHKLQTKEVTTYEI